MLLPDCSFKRAALCSPRSWVGLGVLLIPLWAGAADDSYLREVEEEAKRQATTLLIPQVAQPPATPTQPATTPAVDATNERLASGLNRAAFEQALREKKPEDHASYQKLAAAAQQQVYETYQRDNRLSALNARITQLLNAKP